MPCRMRGCVATKRRGPRNAQSWRKEGGQLSISTQKTGTQTPSTPPWPALLHPQIPVLLRRLLLLLRTIVVVRASTWSSHHQKKRGQLWNLQPKARRPHQAVYLLASSTKKVSKISPQAADSSIGSPRCRPFCLFGWLVGCLFIGPAPHHLDLY
jgi:hypothetical protein